jgi:hypothetical protein
MEKLVAQTMQQRNFDAEQWTQQSPKQTINPTVGVSALQKQHTDQNPGQKSVHFSDKVSSANGLDNSLDNGLDSESEFDAAFKKEGFSKIGSTDIFSKLKHIKPIDEVKELKEQLNELNIKMDKIFKHMNIE